MAARARWERLTSYAAALLAALEVSASDDALTPTQRWLEGNGERADVARAASTARMFRYYANKRWRNGRELPEVEREAEFAARAAEQLRPVIEWVRSEAFTPGREVSEKLVTKHLEHLVDSFERLASRDLALMAIHVEESQTAARLEAEERSGR